MKEKLEYLITALDFHFRSRSGESPAQVWARALTDYAFVYYPEPEDERLPISRASERVLHHLEKKEPLSKPIRKFVNHEPLTVHQFVITDAVKALAARGNKLAAIKLIRGAFAGKDNLFCPLAEAKEIFDSIIARR